ARSLHRLAPSERASKNKQLKKLKRKLKALKKKLRSAGNKNKRIKLRKKIKSLRERIVGLQNPGNGGADQGEAPQQEAPAGNEEGTPSGVTIVDALTSRYDNSESLRSVLQDLGVQSDDTLQHALETIVTAHLSRELEDTLRLNISADLLPLLGEQLFHLSSRDLSQIRSEIQDVMNAKLTSEGVVAYLLDHVIAPLFGNPEFMQASLNDLLEPVHNNVVVRRIDQVLTMVKGASFEQWVLDKVEFEAPACLSLPGSSREMFDIMLVDAGPELNPRGRAFWEILKAVQFYYGDPDYNEYLNEIDDSLQELHDALSNEVVQQAISYIEQAEDFSKNVENMMSQYGSDFSVSEVLSKLIANEISARLNTTGIAQSTTIGQYLAQQGLFIDRKFMNIQDDYSSVGDLKRFLITQGLGEAVVTELIDASSTGDLRVTAQALSRPLEKALSGLFGSESLDISVGKA
ncbi:MAG: hypothetical protein KDD55_13645, partial [Bdellovibrionales bacterium]|nr:hypothetical protein [Bdellovibrionales bacterium]